MGGVSHDMRLQMAATMPKEQAMSVGKGMAPPWGSSPWGASDWHKGGYQDWGGPSYASKGSSYGRKGGEGKHKHKSAPYSAGPADASPSHGGGRGTPQSGR